MKLPGGYSSTLGCGWWKLVLASCFLPTIIAVADNVAPETNLDPNSDPIVPLLLVNPSSSSMMTWSQFQTILRTELGTELGHSGARNQQQQQEHLRRRRSDIETIVLDDQTVEQLWNATIHYEWNKLLQRQDSRFLNEATSSTANTSDSGGNDENDDDVSIAPLTSDNYEDYRQNTTNATTTLDTTSPFVVCDMQYARSGEDAASIIRDLLGEYLIVSIDIVTQTYTYHHETSSRKGGINACISLSLTDTKCWTFSPSTTKLT
jgi:hypothetical protein